MQEKTSAAGDLTIADISVITSGGTTPPNQIQGMLGAIQNGLHDAISGQSENDMGMVLYGGKGNSQRGLSSHERTRSHDEIVHE